MSIRFEACCLHAALCIVVSGCGGDAVSNLVAELGHDDAAVRRAAVRAAAERPIADERVVKALAKCVVDSDREVRYFSIEALGKLEAAGKLGLSALKSALQDAEPRVRLAAALAVARIDPQDRSFMPTIVSSMREGDGNTLREVGVMGPSATWAVPTLVELVSSPLPQVRVLAAHDLGRIGPGASSALPALQGAMQDSNPAVKRAAEEASKLIRQQKRSS
jgi:HEAT repeat protein